MSKMIGDQENSVLFEKIRTLICQEGAKDTKKSDEPCEALAARTISEMSSDPLLCALADKLIRAHEKIEFLQREQEYSLVLLDQMQSELVAAYSKLLSYEGGLSEVAEEQLHVDKAVRPEVSAGLGVTSNTVRLVSLARNLSSLSA